MISLSTQRLTMYRFHYMWQFLEIPYQDITIKEKARI